MNTGALWNWRVADFDLIRSWEAPEAPTAHDDKGDSGVQSLRSRRASAHCLLPRAALGGSPCASRTNNPRKSGARLPACPTARGWLVPGYAELSEEWASIRASLKDRDEPRAFLDKWLEERGRAFAIETGQIEGLYTLKAGITERLVAEGLAGAVRSHTVENVEDRTIKGLLADQETAYNMLFEDVASGRPLTRHAVRTWHQLVTRHQETVAGLTADGRRVRVPFRRKGVWKNRPNNPRRPDGVMHEYCPPELVQDEMDRFFALHAEVERERYPVYVEAAWMHHRFVRTHPFQDGNGRVSRMLMAYAFIRRGEPPPVITAVGRSDYIGVLETANTGDLRAFSDYLADVATVSLRAAVRLGQRALAGNMNRPNGNGGRTVGTTYLPPVDDQR